MISRLQREPKRARPRSAGFTMVELVVVIIIVGVLAAVILPRISGNATAGPVFADRIVATLTLAQKTAVTHRRLVCVNTTARALTLRMARRNADTACPNDLLLGGQDDADSATNDGAVAATSGAGLVGTTLFFLPNGDIRRAAADGDFARGTIAVQVSGQTVRNIAIDGRTGYVE